MKKLFFITLLFFSCIAQAQDTIIKKNGDVIRAKITEVGTEEIKFKIYGDNESPVITMKKSDLKTVKVAGQTVFDDKPGVSSSEEDIIVKKTGETFRVKVTDIGTDEVKFKLASNPDGPTISMKKSEIKTMKVDGQTVIDVKGGITDDLITKRDGTVIKAKILEIGTEEVKYKLPNNPDSPVMTVKKSEIDNIKMDGQTVYEHKDDPLSVSNNDIIDRTSTVKFYFFSPLSHHIDFGYEWMNHPGFNWDMALGIIGPGVSSNNNKSPKGMFIRGGPKFLLGSSSDVVTEDTKERYAHPLKGRYIKLEVILNAFSTTNKMDTTNLYYYPGANTPPSGYLTYKKSYQSVTLDLQYGRQYIFGNTMTLAWYMGVGYSFESISSNLPPRYQPYELLDISRYSHTYFGKNFPMVFTWGITVGYVLPAPKWMVSKKPHYRNRPPSRHSMDN